jgi:hypothetical protein
VQRILDGAEHRHRAVAGSPVRPGGHQHLAVLAEGQHGEHRDGGPGTARQQLLGDVRRCLDPGRGVDDQDGVDGLVCDHRLQRGRQLADGVGEDAALTERLQPEHAGRVRGDRSEFRRVADHCDPIAPRQRLAGQQAADIE